MAERRSLSSAMEFTPEKMAFIQGTPKAKERVLPNRPAEPAEAEVEIDAAAVSEEASEARRESMQSPRARRAAKPRISREPAPVPNLDHFRVGVTVRIHPEIADALRRAHLEQKLRRQSPGTQQEIVEVALSDWLERNGFFDPR